MAPIESSVSQSDYALRIQAAAERSSYIENVLRHALIAELSCIAWKRDPLTGLQVFNAEVDDSGFDVVLGVESQLRYVQLKQAHSEKTPSHCSVRLSFSNIAGSCVVLMSYSLNELRLMQFRFFGGQPDKPMANIAELRHSKSPGRRNEAGQRKVRVNYRDIPVSKFQGPLSAERLFDILFPLPEKSASLSE